MSKLQKLMKIQKSFIIFQVFLIILISLIGLNFLIEKDNKDKNDKEDIKIIKRCKITPQAIETFYEDDNYIYQFGSIESGCTYVSINGHEYPIKEAIDKKLITIEEAQEKGLSFIKTSKEIKNN